MKELKNQEITGYQAGQNSKYCERCSFKLLTMDEMLIDISCWSPLYLSRISIQHSDEFSKYTVREGHSRFQFEFEIQEYQSERQNSNKRMVAFMPFACDTFGGSSPEPIGLLQVQDVCILLHKKRLTSKTTQKCSAFHMYLPGYRFLFGK